MKRMLMALVAMALVFSMLIPAGAFAARTPDGTILPVPVAPAEEAKEDEPPKFAGIWNYHKVTYDTYVKRYYLTGGVFYNVENTEETDKAIIETLVAQSTPVDQARDVRLLSRCKNENGHTGKATLNDDGTITLVIPVY